MEGTRSFYGNVLLEEKELKEREERNPIELMYYKTKKCRNNLMNQKYDIYGIEILKKEYIGKEIHMESECVENISKNETIVDRIIEKLKNNSVTPMSLKEIMHDILY